MSVQQKKKKKNNSRLYILIAAVVLLIVMIVLIAVKCSGGKKNPDADSTSGESSSQSLEAADIDPLTGLSGFKTQGKRPIAIVVNNYRYRAFALRLEARSPAVGTLHPRYRV